MYPTAHHIKENKIRRHLVLFDSKPGRGRATAEPRFPRPPTTPDSVPRRTAHDHNTELWGNHNEAVSIQRIDISQVDSCSDLRASVYREENHTLAAYLLEGHRQCKPFPRSC